MTDGPATIYPAKQRQVFFSFNAEDSNRVAVVCRAWQQQAGRVESARFTDSGGWQKAGPLGDEDMRRLIGEAIQQSCVTCVLVGEHTGQGRWSRYEIAHSVKCGNGLLAVRISGIADAQTGQASVAGGNPLAYMGVGKVKDGQYFVFENSNAQWIRYQDYPLPLAKPRYLPDMSVGYVQPLTVAALEYDYIKQDGGKNLSAWIEQAAQSACR
jgi:antiphage defense system Thoeris ThsB-like protein